MNRKSLFTNRSLFTDTFSITRITWNEKGGVTEMQVFLAWEKVARVNP